MTEKCSEMPWCVEKYIFHSLSQLFTNEMLGVKESTEFKHPHQKMTELLHTDHFDTIVFPERYIHSHLLHKDEFSRKRGTC